MRRSTGWAFHYYTRRIVSDASHVQALGGGGFSGTEIEADPATGRDPYTRFRAVMPTEGPLTESGLEVWPRGIYDLVMQISREYDHPSHRDHREWLLAISMHRMRKRMAECPTRGASNSSGRSWPNLREPSPMARESAPFMPGACSTISSGRNGQTERYGLIYVDYRDQKRTIKDSGLWYGRVAASNRLDV